MKNKVIIIILVSLVACDIPGRIELANTSSKNAVYRYITLNKEGISDTTSIYISGLSGTSILFGFEHNWSDSKINEYLIPFKKIELITQSDTIVYTKKEEMFIFFKKHRKGFLKKTIKIKLKWKQK